MVCTPRPPFTYASPIGFHRVAASGVFGVLSVGLSRFYITLTLFHTIITLFARFPRLGHPFTYAFPIGFHRVGASGAFGVLFA